MAKKILKENYITIIIIISLIIVFSIIMRSSLHDKIIAFDNNVFDFMSKIVNNKLTNIYKIVTKTGDFYIPFAILVCILIFMKNKWPFLLVSLCYAYAGLSVYITKLAVHRPRPESSMINMPTTFSFPSGHTYTSIIFYFMLVYILTFKMEKKKRICLLILTFVLTLNIAFSRIYLGVHYFSDVVGSLILVIPSLVLLTNIIKKNTGDKL